MPDFHIQLHGQLSEVAESKSLDINTVQSEVYGQDLKAQVAIVLGAKNPRKAADIKEKVDTAQWISGKNTIADSCKLSQGTYSLKSV